MPPPQTPQITPYHQLPPSKRSRCLTACMIKSGTPLELRSGPKKFKVTLAEPVHIHSDPGLSGPINCIYGPEPNLNSTFLIIWLLTSLRTNSQASKHGQIVVEEVKKGTELFTDEILMRAARQHIKAHQNSLFMMMPKKTQNTD